MKYAIEYYEYFSKSWKPIARSAKQVPWDGLFFAATAHKERAVKYAKKFRAETPHRFRVVKVK